MKRTTKIILNLLLFASCTDDATLTGPSPMPPLAEPSYTLPVTAWVLYADLEEQSEWVYEYALPFLNQRYVAERVGIALDVEVIDTGVALVTDCSAPYESWQCPAVDWRVWADGSLGPS
jgi:hypothetical protein